MLDRRLPDPAEPARVRPPARGQPLRLRVAERFARGEASSLIAKELRVSVRSVQRWRQAWDEGGPRALRSQGPASLPRRRDGRKSFSWRDYRDTSAP
ncbi:helix-turn-helix domain-containing protein [Streptomyces flavidovirens]|uniref:Helix-turn-helix domain-containing protein n=1 Tax=Streptomyces flavidovirens TaxID=67298 RepID=A0ABW6RII7_9ACTN